MITGSDVITIEIPQNDLELIRFNAKEAEIGGRSQVRSGSERKSSLTQDQLVGQMSNYAGVVWLTDSTEPYKIIREQANQNKYQGDGGIDIPGHRVDFKGSAMRGSADPMNYRLPVRPKERHPYWAYVLALVRSVNYHEVYLVGWTIDGKLPPIESSGIFNGAHIMSAYDLYPMPLLKKHLEKFKLR